MRVCLSYGELSMLLSCIILSMDNRTEGVMTCVYCDLLCYARDRFLSILVYRITGLSFVCLLCEFCCGWFCWCAYKVFVQ